MDMSNALIIGADIGQRKGETMNKIICDICGDEIKNEHLIIPKRIWWVVPSSKYVKKYDICRWCWHEMRESIKERRTNEHTDKRD